MTQEFINTIENNHAEMMEVLNKILDRLQPPVNGIDLSVGYKEHDEQLERVMDRFLRKK